MFLHLLRLAWNRKLSHVLLMAEVVAAFLVVFAVATSGLTLLSRYRLPLGHETAGTWILQVRTPPTTERDEMVSNAASHEAIHRELSSLPAVTEFTSALTLPYLGLKEVKAWRLDGVRIEAIANMVSLNFKDVAGLELLTGRWFEAGDELSSERLTVINGDLANLLFPGQDPLGQTLGSSDSRVIGVITSVREEFDPKTPQLFELLPPVGTVGGQIGHLLLRPAAGTTMAFEEELMNVIQPLAPEWSFQVKQVDLQRSTYLRQRMVQVSLLGVVSFFLLSMVALGMTGVLWQNVMRRTREFGLRRAFGAGRGEIMRQVVGEIVLMASFGLVLGLFISLQIPAMGVFGTFDAGVIGTSAVVSTAFMLLLTALCGLHPGWAATRVHPAEALHHE